jgi:hypothetical protein
VNGDYTWSGSQSGSGILLVTGTLTITGTPNYNEVVLVVGQGSLVYKGSGNGTINGGLFIANTCQNCNANPPQYLASSGPPGAPGIGLERRRQPNLELTAAGLTKCPTAPCCACWPRTKRCTEVIAMWLLINRGFLKGPLLSSPRIHRASRRK